MKRNYQRKAKKSYWRLLRRVAKKRGVNSTKELRRLEQLMISITLLKIVLKSIPTVELKEGGMA